MQFWSKGLGNRTVSLRLSRGEAIKSGDRLYVRGRTEEPVVWDYIMPLRGADFTEFLALLREPRIVEYLYRSPHRWRLYATLLAGGVRFLWLLGLFMLVGRRRPAPDEPTIEVPPPTKRRQRDGRSTADGLARLTARSALRRNTTHDDDGGDHDADDLADPLGAMEVTER
jgi:hypothetical protein